MTKLHETIAVLAGLNTTSNKVTDEAIATFSKKPELFLGSIVESQHFAEDDRKLDTAEHKEVVTTVAEKLLYIIGPVSRALDVNLQRDVGNTTAKADITIGETVLVKDVPATTLLSLETKLVELKAVYLAIPTLAPGPEWEIDTQQRAGVYKSKHPDTRFRTRKTMRAFELSPATAHHPAQVQAIPDDTPIAKIVVQSWSGMISSAQKSELLDRVDQLLRAVKRARQRANTVPVDTGRKIGAALFQFVHDGIIK
jgi:hypothetical protein